MLSMRNAVIHMIDNRTGVVVCSRSEGYIYQPFKALLSPHLYPGQASSPHSLEYQALQL